MTENTEPEIASTQHEYDFEILGESDVPDRPEKLNVEKQLKHEVSKLLPDEAEVEINPRFRKTIADVTFRHNSDNPVKVKLSWRLFSDEKRRREVNGKSPGGWRVITSALADMGINFD